MNNYDKMMSRIKRNQNLALSFGLIPAFLFPVAFELIIKGGEVTALCVGFFYAVTGFLSLYFANK